MGDTNDTYTVYPNGTVADSEGEVVCPTGGADCLEDYLQEKNKEQVPGEFGEANETFTVYPNGTVTD